MRKRLFKCFLSLVFFSLALVCQPSAVYSLDFDYEEKIPAQDSAFEEIEKKEAFDEAAKLVDKEIKYVAGEDNEFFTEDDSIYHYFLIEHDNKGRIYKKSCSKVGADTVILTSDDELVDYQLFEYGLKNRIKKETSFDAQGKIQYTVEYDYDKKGNKIKTTRYDPNGKEIRSMVFTYDQGELMTQDVEYVNNEIEKYHRYEHKDGKTYRISEYHRDNEGKGLDGIWFTEDDVVSATKLCFYNFEGVKNEENKYISPGPDGRWFTGDDGLQYYVLYEYEK